MKDVPVKNQTEPRNIRFLHRTSVFIAVGLSMVVIIGSLSSLGIRGLNLGLDFTGGTIVEFTAPEAVEPASVRAAWRPGVMWMRRCRPPTVAA